VTRNPDHSRRCRVTAGLMDPSEAIQATGTQPLVIGKLALTIIGADYDDLARALQA